MKPTPQFCFEELQPALDEILRLVGVAPLTPDHRAGLAMMVTTYFFGMCQGAFREASQPIEPEELCELLLASIAHEDTGPRSE